MLFYVFKRTGGAILTIFIIATLTFILLRALPGGPFDQEKILPPEIKANIEAHYHLDQPIWIQYFYYLKNLSVGYLGESYKYTDRSVSDIIIDALPVSIQLGLYALILAYLFGVPCGLFAATRQNTWMDRLAMILAISGVSLPSFLAAPVLILFFCFYLGWFEVALWEGPSYYVLPMVVLGLYPASVIARLTRASALDVIQSDYVRTARAKGLHPWVVLYKHIFEKCFFTNFNFFWPSGSGYFDWFFYRRAYLCRSWSG